MTTIKTVDATTETAVTVVNPESQVSVAEALHFNNKFASAAKYGAEETTTARRLSWSTGNNKRFAKDGKKPMENARGWYVDQPDADELYPDDYEFIEAMELLCERGLAAECVIDHQGTRKPSWYLPVASLFIVCEGIPSRSEMKDVDTRWGVAYGWNPAVGRTELHFQCFVKELCDAGYSGLFVVKFSNKVADKALLCLKQQEYVLKFADEVRQGGDGQSEPLPFYAFALPITVSTNTLIAGKGEKTTEVYFPYPVIPRLTRKDPESAMRYLASVAISHDQALLLEYDDRVGSAVEWSIEKSRRLINGDTSDTDVEDLATEPADANLDVPEDLR